MFDVKCLFILISASKLRKTTFFTNLTKSTRSSYRPPQTSLLLPKMLRIHNLKSSHKKINGRECSSPRIGSGFFKNSCYLYFTRCRSQILQESSSRQHILMGSRLANSGDNAFSIPTCDGFSGREKGKEVALNQKHQ